MKYIFKYDLFLVIYLFPFIITAQSYELKGIFSSPLSIPLTLSGNFGELRSNHFHGGLDIKTESIEGKVVLAVADGYISRIKISPSGYGNVLYINHTNNYMTVYGHLKCFRKDIEEYTLIEQYENLSFPVDLEPEESRFPVRKGDTIAFSGNSGSSGGPHLHFEIRDINSEITYNPLLFGFEIKDNVPPLIEAIEIVPCNSLSLMNGLPVKKIIPVKKTGANYHLNINDPIDVSGDIGFGILCFDRLNGESNKCGIYSIELLIDGNRTYYFLNDQLVIDDSRYLLSHIDYKEKLLHNRAFQKSYIDPNNLLTSYHDVKGRGILQFYDDSLHNITYQVKDTYGNISILNFNVQSHKPEKKNYLVKKTECARIIPFQSAYTFESDSITITFPEKALYDTLYLQIDKSKKLIKSYSPVYNIHNRYTPLHKAITLCIKADSIPLHLIDKLLIASVNKNKNNNKISLRSVGGIYSNGMVTANTREFGNYTIVADTIPPVIKPVNISKGKKMSSLTGIKFTISDNLSGIDSYNGLIDDIWVLFRYDEKRKLLYYEFDKTRMVKNVDHKLFLKVSDKRNNEATFETNFYW